MFTKIAAFELRYQLKSPVFWIGFLIFFLLAFGATTMEEIQIGARGNVHVNSPYAIVVAPKASRKKIRKPIQKTGLLSW